MIATWILILFIGGHPTATPLAFHSTEACVEAGKAFKDAEGTGIDPSWEPRGYSCLGPFAQEVPK